MTMAATYGTFAGQTVYEERGGVERVYVSDTLASTAVLTDTAGNVTDTFKYWSYGEERVRTGTTPTPFRFVGTLGYYQDAAGKLYVRARTLMTRLARWMTVDPLWPMEKPYAYVDGRPHDRIDLSGRGPITWPGSTHNPGGLSPAVLAQLQALLAALAALGITIDAVLLAIIVAFMAAYLFIFACDNADMMQKQL